MLSGAPVLYLRSFKADLRGQPAGPSGGGALPALIVQLSRKSFEDKLAAALSNIGPFIAVGSPWEQDPPSGAARLYLSNEEWKPRVEELLNAAACVVIQAGGSPGLVWELETIVHKCDPTKVVIALPSGTVESSVDCNDSLFTSGLVR